MTLALLAWRAVQRSENDARPRRSLDPLMSLEVEVTLEPSTTVTLAFVTAVAPNRAKALELARRFGSSHAVRWAIHDAERQSARRLEKAGIKPELLPQAMRLTSTTARSSAAAPPAGSAGFRSDLVEATALGARNFGRRSAARRPRSRPGRRLRRAGGARCVYRFLRACKVRIELVFLDELASGYQADEIGRVRSFLARAGASSFLHQRGGIFVLAADQLGADDRLRIEACARVFIDADRGSLEAHWLSLPALPPALAPVLGDAASRQPSAPRVPPEPKLRFWNGLGGFTEDGREYVIVLQSGRTTPAPWCNVLANPGFGCLVSESSLGATWSAEQRREPAHAVEKRSSERYSLRGALSAGRRDRGGLVADSASRRRSAPMFWCDTAPATPSTSAKVMVSPKSSRSSCLPTQRSRSCASGSRTASHATGA